MPRSARLRGFSLIELLVVVAIVLILASVAIPNFMRARRIANEASSVASLRSIASGQLAYRQTQGNYISLSALGTEKIIDDVLASGTKSGYTFDSAAGSNTASEFTAVGAPAVSSGFAASGVRFFFVNQDQVVRFSLSGPASASSSPLTD